MLSEKEITKFKTLAKAIRKDIITMSYKAQSAHIGGALSCVEILTILYFKVMKVYPKEPLNDKRDRLVFSKAHDAKTLFSALSHKGFFPKNVLNGYEANNGKLPGHSTRFCVPGVEVSAGSLGHGLSIAAGMAFAAKKDKKKHKIYAILSDGECDEGSTWEAVLFAAHHKLNNLTVIVDYNKLQGFGYTKEILNLENFLLKWQAFNWEGSEVDGHDFNALEKALKTSSKNSRPKVVIAHTVKGLGGVEKYINTVASQYKPPTEDEFNYLIAKLT